MDWRDIPSLSALRAFEAAARLQSYSGAARELNVTHAAIAQHVRNLEREFGLPLMQREGRKMIPTVQGKRLAADLANGFAEIAAGVRGVRQGGQVGSLSISTTRNFAENWLVPRLAGFWKAHPDIPLSITPETRVSDLRRDGHDLAIRFGRGMWPGLEVKLLTRANAVVVGDPSIVAQFPKGYAATAPDAIDELAKQHWLIDASFGEFFTWVREKGLDASHLSSTIFDSNALVLAACRSGAGISVQPYAVVERDLTAGRLVALLEAPEDDIGYYLVRQPGAVSGRLKRLIDWLQAVA